MSHIIRADMRCLFDGCVGAFAPHLIKEKLRKAIPGVMVCEGDLFAGYAERVLEVHKSYYAEHGKYLGIVADSDLRKIKNFSPRYHFRIYSENGKWAEGIIDRYTVYVMYEDDEHFSPDLQQKFRDFLESLDLGKPNIWSQ